MKNIGVSVQARLKNLSRETGIEMPSLLRRYVQERLLYRLSVSGHAQRFALKGGLLMAAYNGGSLTRPTDDIDFNGMEEGGSVESLREMLVDLLSSEVQEDGVEFDLGSMTVAKDRTGIVPGGKIVMNVRVGSANVDLRIDVGFGNPVTPGCRPIDFPSLLSELAPSPVAIAYPLETVIAEKLHAMAQFGIRNTRVKDYYDILMLSRQHSFDGDLLAEAVANTFSHQQRPIPERFSGLEDGFILTAVPIWKKFAARLRLAPAPDLAEVVRDVADFVMPAVECARVSMPSGQCWEPGQGWNPPAHTPR